MDRMTFARQVAALSIGKRLPDGVYAHVELAAHLPAELREAVEEARGIAGVAGGAFQVVKLWARGFRLSLLAYPGFWDEAFPALTTSWVVDLGSRAVTQRTYAADSNPPRPAGWDPQGGACRF